MDPSKSCKKFPLWLTNLNHQEPGPLMMYSTVHSWCITKRPRNTGPNSSTHHQSWLVIWGGANYQSQVPWEMMSAPIPHPLERLLSCRWHMGACWPSPCWQLSQEVPSETPSRWKHIQNHKESIGQINNTPHTIMSSANSANIPLPLPQASPLTWTSLRHFPLGDKPRHPWSTDRTTS